LSNTLTKLSAFTLFPKESAFLKDKNFKTILKKEKNNKNVHKRLTASSL
jgi:hypothetical protein